MLFSESISTKCSSNINGSNKVNPSPFKKIIIFGKPGGGKSTFATWLSEVLGLPLHHLDKHFYISNWIENDYNKFLKIQKDIVQTKQWIIDGNNTRSLEIRWAKADAALYFNLPKPICYFRIFKRYLKPNKFNDRAPGCKETIRLSLLKYMWNFDQKITKPIEVLKKQYPHTLFKEIKCENDLNKLRHELTATG
jgi:adenylate kinase family enzyme